MSKVLKKLKGLFQNILGEKTNSQLTFDMIQASLLLKSYKWQTENGYQVPMKDILNSFDVQVAAESQSARQTFVHKAITEQIIEMFKYLKLQSTTSCDSSKVDYEDKFDLSNTKTPKFSLEVRRSTIDENAGDGVFVKTLAGHSSICPGTVLALYPGYVHLKEHLAKKGYYEERRLAPENDPNYMILVRHDEIIIDGRTASQMPPNPYALGHMINHPNSDREGNCIQINYDFRSDPLAIDEFPRQLRQFIPNIFAEAGTLFGGSYDISAFMNSSVVITNRRVNDGDEILLDYRLRPQFRDSWPAWYQETESSKRRYQLEAQLEEWGSGP